MYLYSELDLFTEKSSWSMADPKGVQGSWGAFSESDEHRINETLRAGLPKEFVKIRPGAGGKKLEYLEGGAQLEIANHGMFVVCSSSDESSVMLIYLYHSSTVFGAMNWSSQVLSLDVDYCRQENSKWVVGVSALVRAQVKNGAFHEDVGYGVSKDNDQGASLERARKAAVTDGRKRALRCFGELLGNSLKHKDDNSKVYMSPLFIQFKFAPMFAPMKLTLSWQALNENFESRATHSPVQGASSNKGSSITSTPQQQTPLSNQQPLQRPQHKQHEQQRKQQHVNATSTAVTGGAHPSSVRPAPQEPGSGSPNEVFEYTLPASVQPTAKAPRFVCLHQTACVLI